MTTSTDTSAIVAPLNHRPTELADLRKHETGLKPIIDVHATSALVDVPGALAALGDLLDAIRTHNATRDHATTGAIDIDANAVSITIAQHPTDTELQKTLAERADLYDRGRALWQQYLDDHHAVDFKQVRYVWSYYLSREGLDNPAMPNKAGK